jgi:hypothetical protein
MKTQPFFRAFAAAIFLGVLSGHAVAGSLTIENGPSFLPPSSFTNNSIDVKLRHNPAGLDGDVARLYGDSMVAPAEESPRILVGGDFSADSNDLFSVVYDFTVKLNSPEPITLTIGAQTTVAGVQQIFNTMLVITPGLGHYQGHIDGPLFALATSGTWSGHLYFNFITASEGGSTDKPDPGNLTTQLRYVDFQLVAVPEPSSFVSLGLGLALLGSFMLRRRRLA